MLMSVYIKEKAEHFHECMESILKQSLLPNEIVIVEDGPITDDLSMEIEYYKQTIQIPIKVVPLHNNQGLGPALAEGIKHCKFSLVARMDTDDICMPKRFEKQIKEFENCPELDIVGSYILEFDGSVDNIISERKVPLFDKDIRKYQKRRGAFNHMTVMYRKEAVLQAGNYQDIPLMEDDDLWCRMFLNGCISKNIGESLVYARTGRAMIERRGGFSYFKKYQRGRKKILQTGYITKWDFFVTSVVQFIVSMLPGKFRMLVFIKLLRTAKNKG